MADSMVGRAIEQIVLGGPPASMMARLSRLTWVLQTPLALARERIQSLPAMI